jgi:hypothetical protein
MPDTTTSARTIDLRTAGPCRPFRIPDSNETVGLAGQHTDSLTGATTALVRFPGTWTRPIAGHYLAAEDFVVLAGGLRIDDVTYEAKSWGYLARGHRRGHSDADQDGAIALAWFDRQPRWVSGGHHIPDRPSCHRALDRIVPRAIDLSCPLPVPGEQLRRDDRVTLWLTDGVPASVEMPRSCEILGLDTWQWQRVPAGTTTSAVSGPCLLREENAS